MHHTKENYGVELDENFVRKKIMPGTAEEMIEQFSIHLRDVYGKTLNCEISDDVPKWIDAYKRCDVLPTVYEGAVKMLALSKELGKNIPLITSGLEMEVAKNMKALEIAQNDTCVKWDLYDTIISYDDLKAINGSGKPDTLSMELAFKNMELKGDFFSDRVMYVGDSISDMRFALNLDGVPVFVATNITENDLQKELGNSSNVIGFSNINQLYQDFSKYIA